MGIADGNTGCHSFFLQLRKHTLSPLNPRYQIRFCLTCPPHRVLLSSSQASLQDRFRRTPEDVPGWVAMRGSASERKRSHRFPSLTKKKKKKKGRKERGGGEKRKEKKMRKRSRWENESRASRRRVWINTWNQQLELHQVLTTWADKQRVVGIVHTIGKFVVTNGPSNESSTVFFFIVREIILVPIIILDSIVVIITMTACGGKKIRRDKL